MINRLIYNHGRINNYKEMYYNDFSFDYKYKDNESAKNIKNYIEKFIVKNNISDTSSKKYSETDEIIKFKELLDKGIITQEEFDMMKKQLLIL